MTIETFSRKGDREGLARVPTVARVARELSLRKCTWGKVWRKGRRKPGSYLVEGAVGSENSWCKGPEV